MHGTGVKMLLHVSKTKMSSSGSSFCLTKITYRFFGLGKIKLLKYKMVNFNKMLIVQRDKRFAYTATMQDFYHAAQSTYY